MPWGDSMPNIRTHRWMQIAKFNKEEYVGIMEETILEMSKELSEMRMRESIVRE